MKKPVLLFLLLGLLAGNYAQAQTLNGDFETWRTYQSGILHPVTLEAPYGWNGLDSLVVGLGGIVNSSNTYKKQVFKSTSAHGGSFAAQLITRNQDTTLAHTLGGAITNGKFNVNIGTTPPSFTFSGGTPVTGRTISVNAWIKHMPRIQTDSALALVYMTVSGSGGADSIIGGGSLYIYQTYTAYTQITIPVVYASPTATPSHIIIVFSSSVALSTTATDSSMLFVDDVTATTPTGIIPICTAAPDVYCYPNPAAAELHLVNYYTAPVTWSAFSATGQLVATRTFTNEELVSIAHLPAGNYFYRVQSSTGQLLKTGSFVHQD